MSKIIKGAFILGVGTLITKILGAVYRIPLIGLIGAEGMGIYQMVFPLYLMLLTVSSSGLPTAISKRIAEDRLDGFAFKKALTYFAIIGLILTFLLILFSKPLAKIQGNLNLAPCYIALAPAVFFVSIIAPIRGCFQGFRKMLPTSLSQIIEQAVKVGVSLYLIKALNANSLKGALLAFVAISISEALVCVYLVVLLVVKKPFKNFKNQPIGRLNANFNGETSGFKSVRDILKISFPVMLCSMMIPLSRMVDSFLVVRLMSGYTKDAVLLYGLYSGGVESIIGVCTGLVFGLSTSAIPIIAKQKDGGADKKLIGYAFIFSSLAGAVTLILGPFAIGILFGGLNGWQIDTTVKLLRLATPSIIGISIMQATTSVLIAKDKLYFPSLSMLVGVLVKICGILLLVSNPKINVYGNAFCDILCYFVASFFNLLYIICERKFTKGARCIKATN